MREIVCRVNRTERLNGKSSSPHRYFSMLKFSHTTENFVTTCTVTFCNFRSPDHIHPISINSRLVCTFFFLYFERIVTTTDIPSANCISSAHCLCMHSSRNNLLSFERFLEVRMQCSLGSRCWEVLNNGEQAKQSPQRQLSQSCTPHTV